MEAKKQGRAPKTETRAATPGGKADSDSGAGESEEDDEDYDSDEAMEMLSQQMASSTGQRGKDGQRSTNRTGGSKTGKGQRTKADGLSYEDDMNEEYYELEHQMLPAGEEPGLSLEHEDDYVQVMGKSSKRGPQGARQSVQHLLKADAMKKIEAGNYDFKRREEQMDDEDIMYGMDGMDGLSAQEEEEDWAEMDAVGSRRRNGGGRSRPNHEDDWDAEGM